MAGHRSTLPWPEQQHGVGRGRGVGPRQESPTFHRTGGRVREMRASDARRGEERHDNGDARNRREQRRDDRPTSVRDRSYSHRHHYDRDEYRDSLSHADRGARPLDYHGGRLGRESRESQSHTSRPVVRTSHSRGGSEPHRMPSRDDSGRASPSLLLRPPPPGGGRERGRGHMGETSSGSRLDRPPSPRHREHATPGQVAPRIRHDARRSPMEQSLAPPYPQQHQHQHHHHQQQQQQQQQTAKLAPAAARVVVSPELDFCSDSFDPVAALAATHVTLPYPSVMPMSNIAKFFTTVLMPRSELEATVEARRAAKQARVAEAAAREKRELAKMAFHPSQRPQQHAPPDKEPAKPAKPRKPRNVLGLMGEEDASLLGPLATLHRALRERREVVVQVRDSHCVRGTCRGVVAAFDRHMNVVLIDVTENFSRKVLRQRAEPAPPDSNSRQRARHNRPRITVETATRHLDQLLIRGDSVATVQLPDLEPR